MAKMGAPKIEIDLDQLSALCRMKPTLEDCAAFFKCSPDTVERRIKEATDLTFADFREQSLVHTRFDLIRKAIKKADQSDTMHIYCLKNLAGWRDKQPDEVDKTVVTTVNVNPSELEERIKQIKGEQ